MNTAFISYQSNDEISDIMKKKFAAKFKGDSIDIFDSNFDIAKNDNNKNGLDYKINKVYFLFPSIKIKNIEHIFNSNKDLNIEDGIEHIKKESLNQPKNNIIKNNIFKKRPKRNYNSLLNQIKNKPIINTSSNNITQNPIIINNNKTLDNSRTKVFGGVEEKNLKELTKMELKTVDKVAEEINTIKNNRDLRNYLFIQLAMLENKKDQEKKIQKINNLFNELDKDYKDLDKCSTTIINPINKKAYESNKKENSINELNDKINKVKSNIAYYENMGNLFLNILNIKKMNI